MYNLRDNITMISKIYAFSREILVDLSTFLDLYR